MDAIWNGPVDDRERQLQPGFLRSSETPVPLTQATPTGNLGLVWAESGSEPPFDGLIYWALGANWKWQDFFADPANPVAMLSKEIRSIDRARVGDMTFAQALNATSTDLERFRNNGGKLLLYQGWADPLIPGFAAVDYWQGLRQEGTWRLADYARLFMVPGMWHCAGGPGPNVFGAQNVLPPPKPGDPSDDALAALIAWVEHGRAPETIIATKYVNDRPAQGVAFQRPLCRYPRHAAYRGSGDPKDPASFDCVRDENNRVVAPARIYGP
jgi:feruloyl esterase